MTEKQSALSPLTDLNRANLIQRIAANAAERWPFMIEAFGADASDALKSIEKGMPQSFMFMVEIIPPIHKLNVHEPLKFVRRLQTLPHDFVIIACPWNEYPLTTPQHVTTVTKEITRQMGARDL